MLQVHPLMEKASTPCLAAHKAALSYGFESGVPATDYAGRYVASPESVSAKGLRTGTATGVTGTGTALFTSLYYDDKERVAQSRAMNHLGKYEKDFFRYSFSGKPLRHLHVHTADGEEQQTELYTYLYDHAERLKETRHKLNRNGEVTLATHTYDELGRLKTKARHNASGYKSTYGYNIRNWLTQIDGNLFRQNLYYHDGEGSHCYNGNIGSITWKNGNEGTRGYRFT